ncbi:MAG: putative rane protein [Crocinitomicaceae bacterium]|jgi:hypothetical protein|nr:putative rane protein [Crocinitomicaceae bacterium]
MWSSARQWIKSHVEISVFLAYLLLTLLCFFPLVNGSASLNWDASDLWLPWKHFITEELYNGQLPLWNPYHVNGFPQQGDSMTWYPLSWLFGFLNGQYNLSALNQEYLFHIFVAGLAFYRFSGNFIQSRKIRFLLGLSYMLSGFMIGNAQHVSWIISAAWMPLVFHYIIQILRHANKKAIFKLALTGFFFFSGGYLAIFFVALYIITIGLAVYFFRQRKAQNLKPAFIYPGISFLLIVLLSLPLLLSAWNIFPLFNRFDPSDPNFNVNTGSTPLNGILAVVLPLASGIYNMTEIEFGSFSAYLGLVPVLLLCFFGKHILRQPKIGFLVLLAVFFLLCSMGDLLPLRALLSKLPLLDLFRYPALFRLFFIFFLLLAAGMATERLPAFPEQRIHRIAGGLIILILLSTLIFSWLKVDFGTITHYFRHFSFYKPLESLKLYDRIFLNSMILLASAVILLLSPRKKLKTWLFMAWGAEILLVATTSAPHTVYHRVNVPYANELLSYQPQNYAPVHRRHPEKEQQSWDGYLDFSWQGKTIFLKQWSKHWYNPLKLKKPAGPLPVISDAEAEQMTLFSVLGVQNGKPVSGKAVKASINNTHEIRVKLPAKLSQSGKNYLLVKQRLAPGWLAHVDGSAVRPSETSQGFILVPLTKSSTEIRLVYDASAYKICFWIFLVALALILGFLGWNSKLKSLYLIASGVLLLVVSYSSWERLSHGKKITNSGKSLLITANELDNNEQFRSLAYWKKHRDLLLIQNYPKTDGDISYFRYFYPEKEEIVTYKGRRYTRYSRNNEAHNTFYSLKDTAIGNNFALDLLTLGKLKNKLICLRLDYKAPGTTPLSLWIAQLRDGKWIDGKTFPLGDQKPVRAENGKILLRYLDLAKFRLLPGDELRMYTWCDDPNARIDIQKLELSLE